MKKAIIVGAGLLGLTLTLPGCSTEPSGGKLPPPGPAKSDEEARKEANEQMGKMMSKMKGAGAPGAPKIK